MGDTLRVDEQALANGALILDFDWPVGEQTVSLRATYPDSFPRLRPIVQLRGDPANFPKRHCSPTDGTLCLLGRDAGQWLNRWTLAKLLQEQLAHALQGTGEEDEQGEPAEYWWNALAVAHSYCLVDSQWTLGQAIAGMLTLRYDFQPRPAGAFGIRAVVRSVRDSAGQQICSWQGALPPGLAADGKEALIPWVYLDETPLPTPNWPHELHALMARLPSRPHVIELSGNTSAQIFAIAYRSELEHGKTGLAWLFGLFAGSKKHLKEAKPGQKIGRPAILPTYRAGALDLGARVPAVKLLRDKRIAIIGLGAIGAPVALELARAGCGELHLIDHDTIEPGNGIRWPLGASAWGVKKTESLTKFIEREYPWTSVRAISHMVGQFGNNVDPLQGDACILQALLAQVDLVVDASTSNGVLNILGDYCRELGLPLISLYASPPVHGGEVVRFAPASGCPTCRDLAADGATIPRAAGFGELASLQQPPGCAERTFTGASFDLQELSLQAVRLAIETLRDPQAATHSLVQVLSLVDPQGRRTLPSWSQSVLPKSAACSCNAQHP